ncbi:MAG: hypothetical protein WCZ90_12495 [Melioribacteraceae bacterium]
MAHFKNSVLGDVNGRIGNLVFRKMNGKHFVSLRPRYYKKSNSENAKLIRDKFALIAKLASFVNKDPLLSQIWQQSNNNPGSVYHKVISYNMRLSVAKSPTPFLAIVPESNIKIISQLEITNGFVSLTLDDIGSILHSSNNITAKLIITLLLNKSVKKGILLHDFAVAVLPLPGSQLKENNTLLINLLDVLKGTIKQDHISEIQSFAIIEKTNSVGFTWSKVIVTNLF